jgi:hypothetical protein
LVFWFQWRDIVICICASGVIKLFKPVMSGPQPVDTDVRLTARLRLFGMRNRGARTSEWILGKLVLKTFSGCQLYTIIHDRNNMLITGQPRRNKTGTCGM